MARQESEREDLLREATALVERIELAPAESGGGEHVVIGFRSDGALSIYFGSDPAYHFNSSGQLRRAFCGGLLLKAEQGRLISLERVRRDNEVQLVHRELLDEDQERFLAGMHARMRDVLRLHEMHKFITVGQVPADADVLSRAMSCLYQFDNVKVADSPHAR